ncbi:transposase [Bacillus cereus]|uniref:Transposase n=1 Tax=Bacillus cereus TaxID=1396 RepID=A0AAW5KWE7_BACCE|nr:transposase [Bacillus cereus]MCQ6284541.1 transposase [Bacillus cereus]MCQ6314192.1 transposase [Bacillus cereus]MCQ6329951.1 transposase [Bacillus cereus]MCQ6383984.1 transposase [Bacillus cereus]
MSNPYNRHDLTDENWNKLEPLITELLGKWGGCNANDNRLFVNACLWIIRTGSPWRDLPNGYGKFNAVHRRYKRWCDKGYDSDEFVRFAKKQGMNPVIPPRKNRNEQREYDKHLYKLRHLVENAFLKLKRFRGIATRYTKTTSAFRGAVTLAAISLWLNLV